MPLASSWRRAWQQHRMGEKDHAQQVTPRALATPRLLSQFQEGQSSPLPCGTVQRPGSLAQENGVPGAPRVGQADAASAGSCLLFYPWPPTQLAQGPGIWRGANLIALMVCNQM